MIKIVGGRLQGLTGLPAGVTVSTMASLLAAVEATAQLVAADHEALVLNILEGRKNSRNTHKFCPRVRALTGSQGS